MDRRTFALAGLLFALLSPRRAVADNDDDDDRARKRLGITREQQNQIEALYRATDRQRRDLRTRLDTLYREMDRLYARYDFDRARARTLANEISTLRRRSLLLYTDNEEKLRRILNREQFERLRDRRKNPRGDDRDSREQEGR